MNHVSYFNLVKYAININSYNEILFITIGIPVVFALLPDRKATTYIYLFNVLFTEAEKVNKQFNPFLIMTDFESGVARAISIMV